MSSFQIWMFTIALMEMFCFGIMIGHEMSRCEDPNSPKPKNWENLRRKEWEKGFKAGEKSMANRMSAKLNDEKLLREYYDSRSQNP